MKCGLSKLLNRFADNELSFEDKALMERHLLTCSFCAKDLKVINTLRKNIAGNTIESNPDIFWQALNKRMQKDISEEKDFVIGLGVWARRLVPVPVIVAIVAVILFSSIPSKSNVIDDYVFGVNFSNVSSLIGEPAGQSGIETLLY